MRTQAKILFALVMVCATAGAALAQKAYPTPQAAADAFADAVSRHDEALMRSVLGENWKTILPVKAVTPEDVKTFVEGYQKEHHIEETAPGKAVLEVGGDGWTLPVPLRQQAGGWSFDVAAGKEEMRTRRIGRNELDAMQAALAYTDAQKDYAEADRNGNGRLEYAQRLISSPGKRDGLFWPTAEGEPLSPLGPAVAKKSPEGGYHGYHFKILTSQGKDARGGAYSYVQNGEMTRGFGLVAWPVEYGETGVMTFMINHDGKLYEKDLGPQSEAVAGKMTQFEPDSTWREVKPDADSADSNPPKGK